MNLEQHSGPLQSTLTSHEVEGQGADLQQLNAQGQAPGSAWKPRWTRRGLWETLFLIVALLANFLLLPHYLTADGYFRYHALADLLSGKGLSANKYSLIGPLFAAPLVFLATRIGLPALGYVVYNTVLYAITLFALYLVLRRWLEPRLLRAFLLLLTCCSMLPYHLLHFYGEVFTAACVALGLALLTLWGKRLRVSGVALLTLGVANTPATVVALALVIVKRIWDTRHLRSGLVILAALALIAAEAWLRRGSPLASGYAGDRGPSSYMPFSGQPGFSYPELLGAVSILFSFGKGLIFYTPGLFLPVRRRMATLWGQNSRLWSMYSLWLIFVVGLVVVYSKWWAWEGSWFWGPRFFLFACFPASFALALWTQHPSARLWVNLLALLALMLSVWVGIAGPVFDQRTLDVCIANNFKLISICDYIPDFSALARPLVNLYLYGPTQKFATVEGLTPRAITYGVFVLFIGCYLALPLLSAIRTQADAHLRAQLSRLASAWREFRF